MLNIWSLAPNGFGFSSSKPNGNHHKSLYMSRNKVQLLKAWIIVCRGLVYLEIILGKFVSVDIPIQNMTQISK